MGVKLPQELFPFMDRDDENCDRKGASLKKYNGALPHFMVEITKNRLHT